MNSKKDEDVKEDIKIMNCGTESKKMQGWLFFTSWNGSDPVTANQRVDVGWGPHT